MEYQIIKYKNDYAITTKEALQAYYKTGFLPYEFMTKYKKTLINIIEKNQKFKNNTNYKTVFLT